MGWREDAVFQDTGQPTTRDQALTYGQLNAAGGYDRSQPQGSPHNPFALRPGGQIPAGSWYVGTDGLVQQAPQAGASMAAAQPWQADAHAPPAQHSQQLGFEKGVFKPIDNASLALDTGLRDWGGFADTVAQTLGMPSNEGLRNAGLDTDAISHAVGMPGVREAIQSRQDALARYRQQGIEPGGAGEIAGEFVGTLPTLAIGGPALQGATAGALTTNARDAKGALADALMGAAGGKLGHMAVSAVGGMVAPQVRAGARWLLDRGVKLTPGQAMGGIANDLEQKATSLPIFGGMVRGARERSTDSFRRGVANATLEPLGQKLPNGLEDMHAVVGHVQGATSDAYNGLLPRMQVQLDPVFASDLAAIKPDVDILPRDQQDVLERILRTRLQDRFDGSGTLTGDALQKVDSDLGRLTSRYGSSADAAHRELADALASVKDSLRSAVTRQNPALADELGGVNSAYARQVRLESAASKSPTGEFSPAQFGQAVRTADKSARKRAYAAGDALMQDWAEHGTDVLGPTVGDSGTSGRNLLAALLLEGSHALHHPVALGSSVLTMLPYTKAGQEATQAWLRPSAARQALAETMRQLQPAGTVIGSRAAPLLAGQAASAQ